MISDAIAALELKGYAFAHFAWSHAPSGDYGTWSETGGTEFKAGGIVAEQVMEGVVDYFTRDDSGTPQADIQKALKDAGIIFTLGAVQYENDTGYIHYSWDYYEHG